MLSLRRLGVCVIAAATLGAAPLASATFMSFVNVPVPADALADDANLAGRVTTDLKVTVPTGFDWSNSAIEIVLTQGSIYNATHAAGTDSAPNPALWTIPTLRNGQADTFVSSKNFGNATIVGSFHNGADLPPPAEGLTTPNATAVRVSWGDTTLSEDGTFTIGRFTLSSDAAGTFNGRTFSSENPGVAVNFSGTVTNGALSVPEPGTLALAAIGAFVTAFQRRRQKRALQ